ncbi:MAG: hypothetical protein ABIJ12_12670 [bacterium]
MKSFLVFLILFTAVLLFTGCERKITGNVDPIVDISSVTCFGCHGDSGTPLDGIAAQFANSVHASGDNTNRNRLYSSRYASCERCHTSEGFIEYVTGVPADGDHFTSFNCFTCHQPHTNGDLRVRVTDPYVLENGATYDRENSNTCASCHHSRSDVADEVHDGVTMTSRYGPHHSNQADMLIGENAYEYDGYDYTGSWHETGVVNGCPSCHMNGAVHESIGGHSWNMVNEENEYENIYGCNVAGCHIADPVEELDRATLSDFDDDGVAEGAQTEVEDLVAELGDLLYDAGLVDADHEPLEIVVSTADSAGAVYNFKFVEEDRSEGIHNTAYAVALLKSSINFLTSGDPEGDPYGARSSKSGLMAAH